MVSTNSVEDREQIECGYVGGRPLVRGSPNLQMGETRILIMLLWMYFLQNWEFGSALSELWNCGGWGEGGGGVKPSNLKKILKY
jgi:hypothetical protein